MIAAELLALLRCPESGQALCFADRALIERLDARQAEPGGLCNRAGEPLAYPLEGGLVRADRDLLYPIRGGIPVLLSAEAIAI